MLNKLSRLDMSIIAISKHCKYLSDKRSATPKLNPIAHRPCF